MAYDAYLWFKGGKIAIEGETQDDEMKKNKAIEIDSFSFGVSNYVTIGSQSGGGGAGKADFSPVAISKRTDKATLGIFEACAVGDHVDEGFIALRRSGGQAAKAGTIFLQFSFKFVMFSNVNWAGGSGMEVCSESVSFEYGAFKLEYFTQDEKGVNKKAGEKMWSKVLNKASFDVK